MNDIILSLIQEHKSSYCEESRGQNYTLIMQTETQRHILQRVCLNQLPSKGTDQVVGCSLKSPTMQHENQAPSLLTMFLF